MASVNVEQAYGYTPDEDNFGSRLIDPQLLQQLQDHFCRANDMYLVCLSKEAGAITKAYGSSKELAYIHSLVDAAEYMQLARRMGKDTVESMLEQSVNAHHVKMCGVATRLEGKTEVIWIVIAILSEKIDGQDEVPEYVMKTTEERFYHSVEFLEMLSKQLLGVKLSELIAQEAMLRSEDSEKAIEKELHRSEAMTEVVRLLESENAFEKLAESVIRETCLSLGIAAGCLFRRNKNDETADIVCEYSGNLDFSLLEAFGQQKVADIPFFDGKPYMISTSSVKPEAFTRFFKQYRIGAAVCQPIEAGGENLMYLCFYETEKEREWDETDIKFINDVKRVVSGILSKRIAKNSLASSYASLKEILENAGCGIYVVDYNSRQILYTNQKFKELFANSIAAGQLEELLFSEQEVVRTHYYEECYSVEEDRWLDVHKTTINWVDGRTVNLCTLYDITDKKIYQREMENQANNDFLTGLFNRMRCEKDLERLIARAQSVQGEGALLYMDLDDFKHINDGLGHQYGDVLLKAISHSFRHIEGVENSCYRVGGDEFIILVPDTIYPELGRIVKEVGSIFTNPWLLKGENYYCTMSMGIVCFPSDGSTAEDLVRKADMALLAAKRRGKNRIEYYNDKDETSAYQRLDLEKNMRTAAMNACSEFEVYYQPIVDVTADGMPCCGAEALVRWNSDAMGFIHPDDFIPLAEYLGLINPIGEHVLKTAAERCKYWNDMGHPNYKVNVNLSVIQLLQNDIVKKIRNVLKETRVNPRNLTLEVTESLAINDMNRMKRILSEIKSLGVKVALDDFGTGYSSLNHIREMPLDVIKIDRCFIEHLGEDDFSNAFVRMVSELAASIGVKVCVEGVETIRQLDAVSNMNVGMIQGYYFGKPMKVEEFEAKYL